MTEPFEKIEELPPKATSGLKGLVRPGPKQRPPRGPVCSVISLPIVASSGQCRDLSVSAYASSGDGKNAGLHSPTLTTNGEKRTVDTISLRQLRSRATA